MRTRARGATIAAWMLVTACAPEAADPCREGFDLAADGHCYQPPPPFPEPDFTDALEHLPRCEPLPGIGTVDLELACADGACAQMTFPETEAALGEAGDCATTPWNAERLYCTWPRGLEGLWEDLDRDGVPDTDAPNERIHLYPPYDGATLEGLGVGVNPRCFVDQLGTPDTMLVVDVSGTLHVQDLIFDRYGVQVYDWGWDDDSNRPNGLLDNLYLFGVEPSTDQPGEALYFDHNASTPLLPEVRDAVIEALACFGNPSSSHGYGRAAHEVVERARAQVAALIGAEPDEIVFTSGGTESNNLAIRGAAAARPGRIVASSIEHPAARVPCRALEKTGRSVRFMRVDGSGVLRMADADRIIDEGTAVVTVMHANNELGVLQPIAALSERTRRAGALLHTDAAQTVGKLPVHVDELGVDLLTLASHKLYGPKGVGALYVRRGTPLEPLLLGAGHERGLRPGTENVPGIAGLGAACARAAIDLNEEAARQRALGTRLLAALRDGVPGLQVFGDPERGLPNTVHICFPDVTGVDLLERTPEVAASTGSACHEDGRVEPSAVLCAMRVPTDTALGAVRLSLGRGTRTADVDRAARALIDAWSAR